MAIFKNLISFSTNPSSCEDTLSHPKGYPLLFRIIPMALLVSLILPHTIHNVISGEQDEQSELSHLHLYIAFSGEENGYLEPCGCSEQQLGGLPRRYTLISALRKTRENLVALSLGDLSSGAGRQNEIKMETTMKALGQMGYVAHNIGEKDIHMGLELLSYLSQIHNIALLSSNVTSKNEQDLNIVPYIIKAIKGEKNVFTICILGILSPNLVDNDSVDIEVLDPVESLKPLLAALRNEADAFILLSHADVEESIEFAEIFPELDLVISGHSIDNPIDTMKKVNDTYVIPVGEKGKYLGVAGLRMNQRGAGRDRLYEISLGKEDYYGLSQYYPEETRQRDNTAEIIPLDEKYENALEIESLLKIYQQRLKDEELVKNMYREPHPSGRTFTGNEVCSLCHNKIYTHWQETEHAHAYETLLQSGHQDDPECLFCHTIGMHYLSGFRTIESTPRMKDVGCESCHGPGSDHKESQEKEYGTVAAESCTICHENEHSPNFKFDDYWQKIAHPSKETQQ
ncbi:MAG: hypothetical protein MRK01_11610 [Candidatus Scalindua sp.]|nr:hypothetical protein [Candidatus Scalindua sp.]